MPKDNYKYITNYIVIFASTLVALVAFKLESFTLQIIALLTIIYFVAEFILQRTALANYKKQIDIFFLTSIVLTLVLKTQAINSPLFFLLYFLLFGVSLLFEARASIIMVICITLVLLTTPMKEPLLEFLQLASLYLVLPLAHIFGSQYKKLLQDEEKIDVLTKEGKKIETSLAKKEEKVKDWTSTDFANRLSGIWQDTSSLLKTTSIAPDLKTKIEKIRNELKGLLGSVQKLEDEIEK